MRWLWVDRFSEFVSGSHAAGVKNVSLVEEAVDDYCPGYPMLPPTLVIEGMAQLGGILVAESFEFDRRVVLAKVGRAEYHCVAIPGDRLHLRVDIENLGDSGATVRGKSVRDGRDGTTEVQADIELMFAFLEGDQYPDQSLFEPGDLRAMLRAMGLFEVARDADGNRLSFPMQNL